jgi:hypothetical protein
MTLKEHSLRVLEKRVLGRVFGTKRNKIIVGLRKLHNGSFVTFTRHILLK